MSDDGSGRGPRGRIGYGLGLILCVTAGIVLGVAIEDIPMGVIIGSAAVVVLIAWGWLD